MTRTKSAEEVARERRTEYHEGDVVVVGAGVFGCAIAFALARQGRSVILLERWLKQPDRIVGELLQPGGVAALKKLGLADCLEGIDAVRVDGYQVIYYGRGLPIPYPQDKTAGRTSSEKGSRPEGRSFHHGRFVQKLRDACMAEPNITVVETTVTATICSDRSSQVLGVESQTLNPSTGEKEKDYYFGELTIIADGYASEFRKKFINKAPVVKSKFYALELIDCDLPAPCHGHVLIGNGGPVLLYQIGTHETRALIDVPNNLPSTSVANGGVKGHLEKIVLPTLPEQVKPSFELALAEGKLRSMPNSWLPPTTQKLPGMVILGDAMNMRHPLTGGGMTVVFNDVVLLSELLAPEKVPMLSDTERVQKAMRKFHWQRKGFSSVINILAQALYSLFAADDPQLKALQNGCFKYFEKGGNCIDGPAGLLAGIIKQPLVLFYHFFAVAFLSIYVLMWQMMGSIFGVWKFPLVVGESILVFWKACIVIFPFIFSELRA